MLGRKKMLGPKNMVLKKMCENKIGFEKNVGVQKIFGSGNVLNRNKNVFQDFKVRWSAGWDVKEAILNDTEAILDVTEAILDVAEVILHLSENNAILWPPYGALLWAECGNKAEWS